MFNSPHQAAHYHILGLPLGASCRFLRLAGCASEAQAVTLLTCILEVPASNLDRNIDRTVLVGSEVLTPVVMKSSVFCNIMPCSPLKLNRHFGGTYRLHLQDRRIDRTRNQRDKRSRRWWYVSPKRLLSLNGLRALISEKTILFILSEVYRGLL
jgi:hypothetical protein